MAQIVRIGEIYWWDAKQLWAVNYTLDTGQRKRKSSKNRERLEEFQAAHRVESDAPTLAEIAGPYSRERDLHPITREAILRYLRGPCREFRDLPIERLTRRHILIMRQNMTESTAAGKNKAQAQLHAMLQWALEAELIYRNPWAGAKKLPQQRREMTATLEDFQAIADAAAPHLRWYLDCLFSLACRAGNVELLSLRWSAFHWRDRSVRMRQGKTGRIKTVYPPQGFLDRALERYQADKERGIRFVITYRGRRIKTIYTAWRQAKKDAGLENKPIRPHDARHIVASLMIQQGADIAAVSAQLGHSSIATTTGIYAHVIEESQRLSANVIPQLGTP